ncbi:MAG: transcriptional repressor [Planctomycetota bacterium]
MDLEPVPQSAVDAEKMKPLCSVFRRHLKAENQKYTPERARVLDAVIEMNGLFEADELVAKLRQADFRVSKATVYRTVKLMQDAGIVQRVLAGGDLPKYQLIYGSRPSDLIVRIDTDESIAIDVPELDAICERICAARGLVATAHNFQIFATKAEQ